VVECLLVAASMPVVECLLVAVSMPAAGWAAWVLRAVLSQAAEV